MIWRELPPRLSEGVVLTAQPFDDLVKEAHTPLKKSVSVSQHRRSVEALKREL